MKSKSLFGLPKSGYCKEHDKDTNVDLDQASNVVDLREFKARKSSSKTRGTILYVDGDGDSRSDIRRVLEAEGYRVILAEDGLALSQSLEFSNLDLILLDVNLPWVSGYQLCRMIKNYGELMKVPLILASEGTTSEDRDIAFESGCDDFISKPYEWKGLVQVINDNLSPNYKKDLNHC